LHCVALRCIATGYRAFYVCSVIRQEFVRRAQNIAPVRELVRKACSSCEAGNVNRILNFLDKGVRLCFEQSANRRICREMFIFARNYIFNPRFHRKWFKNYSSQCTFPFEKTLF
jgi:hypothetical protein